MLKLKVDKSSYGRGGHFRNRKRKYYTAEVKDFIDSFKSMAKSRKKIMGYTTQDISDMTLIPKQVLDKIFTGRMDITLGQAYCLAMSLSIPIFPVPEDFR